MIRALLSLIPAASRGKVVRYTVLATISVVLRAGGTVLLIPLIAALFSSSPQRALSWLAAITVITALTWWIDMSVSRIGFDLGFALLDRTQHDVADSLTRTRLDWFTGTNTGLARQAIASGGPELVGLIANLMTPLMSATLLPVAIAVALFFVSWQLGLAALLAVPILLAALWASGRVTRRADTLAADTNSALTERIIEFARTQQALRASRRAESTRSHVGEALASQHGATMRLLLFQIPGQVMFSVASNVALISLAGVTTLLTIDGQLSAPEAVALIVVIARYLEPFTSIGELAPAVETTRATVERIRSVLDAPAVRPGTVATAPRRAVKITMDKVSFGYGDDDLVLRDLDLTLEAGTTTAIVGPSGSGKTTILALLAGLQQAISGRILVDGIDAATLDSAARRELVSMVFQSPYLFDGTIRDNILVGSPDADDARVAAAVEMAKVDEIIGRLPAAMDTVVGEAGATLSGGERQRVSIARALLKPAPVLLVDEATSALDTENESAVVDALTADPQGRTRVIVAHRLASIRTADRVLFCEDGRITEDGTVEELLAAGGRFTEFWRHQRHRSAWRLGVSPRED